VRAPWETVKVASPTPDEALDQLGQFDPRAAEVVTICFFVGLTHEQAARELGVSLSTIERTWNFARAWLFRKIEENRAPPPQYSELPVKGTVGEKRM